MDEQRVGRALAALRPIAPARRIDDEQSGSHTHTPGKLPVAVHRLDPAVTLLVDEFLE